MPPPPAHGRILISLLFGGIAGVSLAAPDVLQAAVCTVPSVSYPTVGAAVRDGACATIQLAAGSYEENVAVSRDLELTGAGAELSIVAGALSVSGATTDVTFAGLSLDGTAAGVAGCWTSLLATSGGARLAANDDVVVSNSGIANGPCRLFADGFESAAALAWSATTP